MLGVILTRSSRTVIVLLALFCCNCVTCPLLLMCYTLDTLSHSLLIIECYCMYPAGSATEAKQFKFTSSISVSEPAIACFRFAPPRRGLDGSSILQQIGSGKGRLSTSQQSL